MKIFFRAKAAGRSASRRSPKRLREYQTHSISRSVLQGGGPPAQRGPIRLAVFKSFAAS